MYLFFDTETSGLPRDWSAPASGGENWPRIVQLAWLSCGDAGQPLASNQYLIKPQGFTISRQAAAVHGITTELAIRNGVDLAPVLKDFSAAIRAAKSVVGHNVEFDRKVIQSELLRAGLPDPFAGKPQQCTMKETAAVCKLPGKCGYKWPSLTELHRHLFGTAFEGSHGALADAEACMRCFFRLRELGLFR
jgi:DNA polymerase III epsilon subunit-like protein